MSGKRVAVLLVVLLTFTACGDGDGTVGGVGEAQNPSDVGSSGAAGGQSGAGDGGVGGSSAQGGSTSDSSDGSDSSESSDGSEAAFGSDSQSGDPGSLPTDSEDWFPTDKRCQIKGNETINVPEGTPISVDVFDVVSGEKLQSAGGVEGLDELLDLMTDRRDLLDKVRGLADDLEEFDQPLTRLKAVGEVAAEEFFHTDEWRDYLQDLYIDPGYNYHQELPENRIAELIAKAESEQLNDDELKEYRRYAFLSRILIAPIADYVPASFYDPEVAGPLEAAESEILDAWTEALASHDLANLSFICGYLFEMDDWDQMVEYWRSVDHAALLSFTETVNRVHAGGDLYSAVIEYTRDGGDGLSPATAAMLENLSNNIGTHIQVTQAYGVTMAGVGNLVDRETGYPFIYLTVKDGGKAMQERLP